MHGAISGARTVIGGGLSWFALWAMVWAGILWTGNRVSLGSLDRGEALIILLVLGAMGLCSGLLFAVLLAVSKTKTGRRPSLQYATAYGAGACVLVQIAMLDHGDRGLLANIPQAMLFALVGTGVSLAWATVARWRSRAGRPTHNVANAC